MEVAVFRFSIRDLLWLTLAVGVTLAWWIDRQQLRADGKATWIGQIKT
jgi:hypothetical protein